MLDSFRDNGRREPNSTYTPKHFILCSQYLSCDWKSHLPINMESCGGRQTSIGKCLAWFGRLKLKQVDIQWLVATYLTQLHDQSYRITWSEPIHLTLCQHYAIHEWMSRYQQKWERCARQWTNKAMCLKHTSKQSSTYLHFYTRQLHMEYYRSMLPHVLPMDQ